MKKIWVYIVKQVLSCIAVCTFLLFSLVVFIFFFGELDGVGTGNYGFIDAFIYSFSILLVYFYYLFPFCCLLGVLFAFGILQKNNELVIVRMAGFSAFKLSVMVLLLIFMFILSVNILDESFGPELEKKTELRKSTKKYKMDYHFGNSGIWLHLKNNFYYIGYFSGKDTVNNIYRYTIDKYKKDISEISYASFAEYKSNKWLMKDVKKTSFNEGKVVNEKIATEEWSELLPPDFIKAMNRQLERLPFKDLFILNKYRKKEGLNLGRDYITQFWKRLFGPITSIAMIFLSMPFVFTTNRSVAILNRVFISALIGCTVMGVNSMVESTVSLLALPVIIVAILPAILGFTVGSLFFYKTRV